MSLIVLLFAKIPEAQLTKAQLAETKRFKFQDFFEKSALPISAMMFVMGFAFSSVLTFSNAYAIEINMESAFSIFFIVYAGFLLASRPFAGKLLDSKGDNIVIYPALILFAVGLVSLSQSYTSFILLFAAGLIGIGFGNLISSFQAVVVNKSPRHRIGLATSTFFIAMDAGVGVGPIVIGAILPALGYRNMYLTMAIVIVAMIVVYYLVHGRKVSGDVEVAVR